MRDSILNVRSSGLGGSVSRHIEKKKREHYRTKKAKINLANKNLAAQNREIEKGRLRKAKIRDKEVADRMKVLNPPKPEHKHVGINTYLANPKKYSSYYDNPKKDKKENKPKYNKWHDRIA